MGLFNKKNVGAVADVIRCDEKDYLIWKWRPEGTESSSRENSIRWGSSLRVKEGSVAAFVYTGKEGAIDYIEGPKDETLSTKNLPIISSIIGAAYAGKSPFQAEVYFINLAKVVQTKFAVPYFDVYDPRFLDFGVPVAVRGTITFQIADYKEFIKLHRLDEFSMEDFSRQIADAVTKYVKDVVANAPSEHNLPVVQLERKISTINEIAGESITKRLEKDFGVKVTGVDIATIEVDKTSDAYKKLSSVTGDITASRVQAEEQDYEEKLRIQREEGQYATRKATQSGNLSAYQLEQQGKVGIAGAEALGQMGRHGATEMSGGMNPAAMMAGMAIGGSIGQTTAGIMNGAAAGINQPVTPTANPAPMAAGIAVGQTNMPPVPGSEMPPIPNNGMPPIPGKKYNVVIDGNPAGPYDLATLKQMLASGEISEDSMVWTKGMTDWQELKTIL